MSDGQRAVVHTHPRCVLSHVRPPCRVGEIWGVTASRLIRAIVVVAGGDADVPEHLPISAWLPCLLEVGRAKVACALALNLRLCWASFSLGGPPQHIGWVHTPVRVRLSPSCAPTLSATSIPPAHPPTKNKQTQNNKCAEWRRCGVLVCGCAGCSPRYPPRDYRGKPRWSSRGKPKRDDRRNNG